MIEVVTAEKAVTTTEVVTSDLIDDGNKCARYCV